jgi:hypothetical protein
MCAFLLFNERQLDILEREAEQMRAVQQRLHDLEKRQKDLENTNKDLAKQLKDLRELKEKFAATEEQDLNAIELRRAQASFDKFRHRVRLVLSDACPEPKRGQVHLTVSQDFKISQIFEKWYKEYKIRINAYLYLFDPLDLPQQSEARLQVVKRWTAVLKLTEKRTVVWQLENAISEADSGLDDNDQKQRSLKPKDEGGPTRFFFSRVWDQVGNLTVHRIGKQRPLELFELTQGGLMPQSDPFIENYCIGSEETLDCVKAYYTAFGRLLAHAILLPSEDHGPVAIASHVLPNLFKNSKFAPCLVLWVCAIQQRPHT